MPNCLGRTIATTIHTAALATIMDGTIMNEIMHVATITVVMAVEDAMSHAATRPATIPIITTITTSPNRIHTANPRSHRPALEKKIYRTTALHCNFCSFAVLRIPSMKHYSAKAWRSWTLTTMSKGRLPMRSEILPNKGCSKAKISREQKERSVAVFIEQ